MKIDPKKVKQILGKNILADGFDPVIDLHFIAVLSIPSVHNLSPYKYLESVQ